MINDEDFKIGNCYKAKLDLPIELLYGYRIPKNSNVICLDSQPFFKHGKIIKLLYIGKIYHFTTFENLSYWFEKL